jgi:DNA-binding transcriptional LysR family regulator
MDAAELEIFCAVAREQSVTRAAKLLDRVQSNVTTRLRQLEETLGVALFLRDNKRMTLTAEGRQFLGYAERLLALGEEARQAMRSEAPSGVLRVGAMESAAASRLPKPLARFHGKWPEVEIDIQTGTTQALVDAVLAHRLDCALVAHPAEGPHKQADMAALGEDLEGVYLFTEKLMLVLPSGQAGGSRAHAPAERPRTLAAFARGCTYRQCALDWLAEGGAEAAPLRVIEMASYHAMLACAAAGTAAAIVPQSLLDLQRDTSEFRCVPVRRAHTFLVRRAGFDTPAYRALLAELRAT